jgi:hypothetical protein
MSANKRDEWLREVADIILTHISGQAMISCGLRELRYGETSCGRPYLKMRAGWEAHRLHFVISYMLDDTYTVELIKQKENAKPVVVLYEAVYGEQLDNIIYNLIFEDARKAVT